MVFAFDGKRPMTVHQLVERVRRNAGLSNVRLHDLRRTMRTGLGKIGVQPHIAELAINHVRGGVEAIYDRHRYEREIKAALALWADHVLTLVNDGERKVIALARVS